MLPPAFDIRPAAVIGHRGSPLRAPENTITAFQEALKEGASGIEMDVRLTSDDEPYVFHDENLRRMAGIDAAFKDLSSDEISSLELKPRMSCPRPVFIPSLREVLETFRGKLLFYIELKCLRRAVRETGILARKAASLVSQLGLTQSSILVSFDYPVVRAVKQINAGLFTGLNFEHEDGLREARREGFRFLDCLCPKATCIHGGILKLAHEHGLGLLTWVVNDAGLLARMLKLGIRVIATDDPAWFVSCLRGGGPS